MALMACQSATTEPKTSADNAAIGVDTAEVTDTPSVDTGEASEDEPEEPLLRLVGHMKVEYTYTGSLGEFSDICSGDVLMLIDREEQIDGEGSCENSIITFNFIIRGSMVGDVLTGILIAQSSAGRVETPFSGVLEAGQSNLTFDHTHAVDGEALRLEGTMNMESDE